MTGVQTLRQMAAGIMALMMLTGNAAAQTIPFDTPPEEIDSVIGLLDAVVIAEEAVLADAPLDDQDLADLETLVRTADILGAEDLAARTRVLLSLLQPERREAEIQPELIEPLQATPENLFRRESEEYNTWIGALAATGGTSIALSGVFYGLAERDFQGWLSESDPDAASELFRAWRGYEILGLTVGGVAIGTLGVGIPLLYALSAPAQPRGLPAGQEMFSEGELEQALQALYAERARIVGAINRLPEVQPARSLWSTIGLSVGALGGITSVTSSYLAGERWDRYLDAPFSDQAESLGTQVLVFDIIAISAASLSLIGFGTTIGIDVLTEDRRELELQLREINQEIVRLRADATEIQVNQQTP